jgi:hypothetical protein
MPTTYEDMGQPKDKLARKLRFPLVQKVYMEHWQTPKGCEVVLSSKLVEHRRKRQCFPTMKVIKGRTNIRNRVS